MNTLNRLIVLSSIALINSKAQICPGIGAIRYWHYILNSDKIQFMKKSILIIVIAIGIIVAFSSCT